MNRKRLMLCGTALLSVAVGLSVSVAQPENGNGQATEAPKKKPVPDAAVKPSIKAASQTPSDQPVAEKRSADEEAIRLTGETYVKAYCDADAKLVSEHFTKDAEYIDEQGSAYHGRQAIEAAMKAVFGQNTGCKITLEIDTIRVINPGVAIEDGTTIVRSANDDEIVTSRYTAVHVKSNGQWLVASVREQAPKDRRHHRSQLRQLAWLEGNWVDEGEDSLVLFSCEAVDDGNYLVRAFDIRVGGRPEIRGTQRIGWDPLTGKLRTWIFDSEGGYSDGFWHRDGEGWTLKTVGVNSDGQPISSTTNYTHINDDSMTWQSVDREIAGVALPDSEPVTIVRRAPKPDLVVEFPLSTTK